MIMLESRNLNVGYGNYIAVEKVNIKVQKGEVLCLLGANGAGKTTILRTLSGLLNSINGEVFIKDELLQSIKKKDLAKKIALVLTSKFSGDLMRVYDVVAMGRYPHTGFFGKLTDEDKSKIVEALKQVNAHMLIHRYFDELSDGEKQKVLVARALVQEPELIILDEPTTHLDIRHRLELIEILKKLSKEKGIAVVISLHEIDIALKSCDKVMLIKNHKVVAYGEPEDVVDESIINGLYGLNENNFNNLLGAIELNNRKNHKVFVIGGGGKGIPIYRALAKRNIGVCTGIIHKNDVDYEIARTMGVEICSVDSFNNISDIELIKALKKMNDSEIVIDSGFEVGNINIKNVDIINKAIKENKTVLSLRNKEEGKKLYKDSKEKIIYLNKVSDLVDNLIAKALSKDK